MRKTGPASWNAVKIVLAAGTPIQKFVSGKGDTHLFCNHQAIKILSNDGKNDCAKIFNKYIEFINRGVLWADIGWKNFAHYYGPQKGQGLGPWPNAKSECQSFFDKALYFWMKQNKNKSFFFLGAATHIVQDLCVPHHAKCIPFCGHNEYEKWVQDNYNKYSVFSNGIYNDSFDAGNWVDYNANTSVFYFPYVSIAGSVSSYEMATEVLLPHSQKTTAGLFSSFMERANLRIPLKASDNTQYNNNCNLHLCSDNRYYVN